MSDFLKLFLPTDLGGERRNNGRYEQFKYHYWGYSKVPANISEAMPLEASIPSAHRQNITGISHRPLRPRRLCLLQDDGIEIVNVEEWETLHESLEYLFICYIANQFGTNEEKDELHRIAEAAARRAGVDAYWVGCSCMPEDEELVEDVYRISDVVRGGTCPSGDHRSFPYFRTRYEANAP
ncbi:uncharacterized protein N7500_002918 [Penicillium coprophilum]|uniref:uncharacterized protein n=1 Tax=Penicillium coprophilum TaxID=36646 RepID=UPI0023959E52|nr:uncharacterized protein N7500_002918 [Penicillium coprophilum]KAJ5170135.1 hypothetical protein N7500_002918 [Penicillium coprophilum]